MASPCQELRWFYAQVSFYVFLMATLRGRGFLHLFYKERELREVKELAWGARVGRQGA